MTTTANRGSDLPTYVLRTPAPKVSATKETIRKMSSNSLVAAARRLTSKSIGRRKGGSSKNHGWQDDAWDMFDQVGEERFLSTVLAGHLSRAKLYVGRMDEDLTDGPEAVDDPAIQSILDSVGDGLVGRGQLVYRLAINLFVAGEGWLVGIPPHLLADDSDEPEDVEPGPLGIRPVAEDYDLNDYRWEMLSVSEVSVNSSDGEVELSLAGPEGKRTVKARADDLFLIRVWRPHPRRAWEADSPTRSSLPVLRELVGLTQRIGAQIDSRLAGAGVFLVPQEARTAIQAAAGLTDDDEDQFSAALMEAMIEPIADRSSASAVVPIITSVPGEQTANFRHISFADDLDDSAREMRMESIRRFALGQDAPPELLEGTGGMNHWGAWLVQEDVVTTHLEPPLRLICDALTTQFLRPVLVDSMGMTEEQAEQFVIWYDVQHLIVRPNKASDALALHERGIISDEAVLKSSGFDTGDAVEQTEQTPRERALDLVMDMVRNAPSLAQTPGIPALVDQLVAVFSGEELPPPTPPSTNEAPSSDRVPEAS